jgi:elongation factor 2
MDADGQSLERAFNMFVLDPILKIANAVTISNQKILDADLDKLGLLLSDQEQGLEGKEFLNAVVQNVLPKPFIMKDP